MNTLPADFAIQFPFFACNYSAAARRSLVPTALPVPDGNEVSQVVLGHPDPARLAEQFRRLGIQQGVRLGVVQHPEKEVVRIVMKNGAIDLRDLPARFQIV